MCVPPSFGFTSLVKFTRLIVILGFWLGAFVVVFFFSDALDGELLRDPFACVMLDNFVEPGYRCCLACVSRCSSLPCFTLDVKEMNTSRHQVYRATQTLFSDMRCQKVFMYLRRYLSPKRVNKLQICRIDKIPQRYPIGKLSDDKIPISYNKEAWGMPNLNSTSLRR